MANQEHLGILKQGIETWSHWREKHAEIRPDLRNVDLRSANLWRVDFHNADLCDADLRGANLIRADLRAANFSSTFLSQADLRNADLRNADLQNANLIRTNLQKANLSKAKFRGANLWQADLRDATLSHTDLRNANLTEADLSGADLIGADFSRTTVRLTSFGNVNLSVVKGLETVSHNGPSTIGIDTLYISKGDIPEVFLKGAGVDDTFITYIRSLIGKPIEYYSCFISYSSKDEAFARRLYADLQSNNVRCWYAPEDLKWGEKIRTGIDEAIRLHDKLLLILSKYSVTSGWVEREVKTALAKESKEKRTVLFPVRVDGAIFDSPFDWATEIRHERNIGDFTRWKQHNDYEKAFNRLLHDLKAEA
jgi:hypothetical protein